MLASRRAGHLEGVTTAAAIAAQEESGITGSNSSSSYVRYGRLGEAAVGCDKKVLLELHEVVPADDNTDM